jgi:two-component system nitrate/nitrite response regulator NarL
LPTCGGIYEDLAMSVIRVFVADDHPLFLNGISDYLNSAGDISVVGTCSDGMQALDTIRRLKPAVAILNMSMPNLSGLEVLTNVNRENLPTRILFIASLAGTREIIAAMAAGAYGFLRKDSRPNELLPCVRDIAAGHKCLPFELLGHFHDDKRQSNRIPIDILLTQREWMVMALAVEGLSNKEIARDLNMTTGTAKIHLYHIFRKVGVKNRTALATMAFRYSFVKRVSERHSLAAIKPLPARKKAAA